MYRLIYSSVQTEAFDAAALRQLLKKSRLRNHSVGVTGMLVYDGGVFLQALEGDSSAVQAVYARIVRDPRHAKVNLLFRDISATTRSFGSWSMGFADASGASQILKGFIQADGGLRHAVIDRVNAVKIIESFAVAA